MDLANPLGEYLRSLRQSRDMTAQDIAQRCQIPVSVVLDLEHGDKPDDEVLHTLSQGLGIPLVDLHRIAQGEPLPLPEVAPPLPTLEPSVDLEDEDERPMTILEAIRGLTPAQIEKVMDYVQLVKLAEKGRRRTTLS